MLWKLLSPRKMTMAKDKNSLPFFNKKRKRRRKSQEIAQDKSTGNVIDRALDKTKPTSILGRTAKMGAKIVNTLAIKPVVGTAKLAAFGAGAKLLSENPELGVLSNSIRSIGAELAGFFKKKDEKDKSIGGNIGDKYAQSSNSILKNLYDITSKQFSANTKVMSDINSKLSELTGIHTELRTLTSITAKVWDVENKTLTDTRARQKKAVLKAKETRDAEEIAQDKSTGEKEGIKPESIATPAKLTEEKDGGILDSLKGGFGIGDKLGGIIGTVKKVGAIFGGIALAFLGLNPVILGVGAALAGLTILGVKYKKQISHATDNVEKLTGLTKSIGSNLEKIAEKQIEHAKSNVSKLGDLSASIGSNVVKIAEKQITHAESNVEKLGGLTKSIGSNIGKIATNEVGVAVEAVKNVGEKALNFLGINDSKTQVAPVPSTAVDISPAKDKSTAAAIALKQSETNSKSISVDQAAAITSSANKTIVIPSPQSNNGGNTTNSNTTIVNNSSDLRQDFVRRQIENSLRP